MTLQDDLRACRLCAPRFAATATAHGPRPVVWFAPEARILLASQAPGARAHASGKPFTDASGVRLRDWMGIGEDAFYDRRNVAIVPMGFCFPGYDGKGSDIGPPAICAATWRARILATLPEVRLTLLIGGAAMGWHLGKGAVSDYVADWRAHATRGIWCLPHPSWRNTAWLKRNAWFEEDVVPALRGAVADVLSG